MEPLGGELDVESLLPVLGVSAMRFFLPEPLEDNPAPELLLDVRVHHVHELPPFRRDVVDLGAGEPGNPKHPRLPLTREKQHRAQIRPE